MADFTLTDALAGSPAPATPGPETSPSVESPPSSPPIETTVGVEIKEELLAAYVTNKWSKWRDSRNDIEKLWLEIIELYLTIIDPSRFKGGWKWRSRVSIPIIQKVHDSICATLSNALIPSEDFFSVMGRGAEDHEYAKGMQKYMAYQIDRMTFKEKFRTFLEQLVMLGTAVAAVPWRKDERMVRREVETTINEPRFPKFPWLGTKTRTETNLTTVPVIDYDGPDLDPISIFDFVVDPLQPNFDKSSCIHRVVVSYDTVKAKDKANNPNGIYNGTNRREQGSVAPNDGRGDENQRLQLQMLGFTIGNDNIPEDAVELLQMWGDFRVADADGKITVASNHVCVVMNRKWIIRFEPNPFWHGRKPYIFGTYRQKLGSPYGKGPLEPVIGLQHLVNTFSNQKADEISLLLSGSFKYVDDGVFEPDSAVLYPGALIPVSDLNNLQPLVHSAPVAVGYNEIQFLLSFIEDSTAASQFVTGGAATGGRKTATEASMTKQAGSERFMEVLKHIEDQVLTRCIEMFYQLNQQFMNKTEVVRVIGPKGITFPEVTPDMVRRNYDFKPLGSSFAVLRDMKVQQLVNFLDILSRNPILFQQINPSGLTHKIYREFGYTDEDQVLMPTPPDVAQNAMAAGGPSGAPNPAGPLAATPMQTPGSQMPMMQP